MSYTPNLANRAKWEETYDKVSIILSSIDEHTQAGQLIADLAVATGLRYMQVYRCLDGVWTEWAGSDDEQERVAARHIASSNLAHMVVYGSLM